MLQASIYIHSFNKYFPRSFRPGPVLGDAGDTNLSQTQALPSRNLQSDRRERDIVTIV